MGREPRPFSSRGEVLGGQHHGVRPRTPVIAFAALVPGSMLPEQAQNRLAAEFQVSSDAIAAFEERLEAGDSIPVLARRHPDRFAGLGIPALRKLRVRVDELRELEQRRANVLKQLDALGDEGQSLRAHARNAADSSQLDDVAARVRKPKGTRGAEAIAKGLEPLADAIASGDLQGKTLEDLAATFVRHDEPTPDGGASAAAPEAAAIAETATAGAPSTTDSATSDSSATDSAAGESAGKSKAPVSEAARAPEASATTETSPAAPSDDGSSPEAPATDAATESETQAPEASTDRGAENPGAPHKPEKGTAGKAPRAAEKKGVATAQEALQGAVAILAERHASDPEIRQRVRREIRERGEIVAKVFDAQKQGAERYSEFFDFRSRGKSLPPRRYLKLRRGERERVLKLGVEIRVDEVVAELAKSRIEPLADDAADAQKALHELRTSALRDAVGRILVGALEVDVRTEWKERADAETLSFLRRNLRTMCQRPPFGAHPVVGVDPGVRKGIRAAAIAADGSFLADATFETTGEGRAAALDRARSFLREHRIRGIAVSSGDSGSQAAAFFQEAMAGSGSAASAVPAASPSDAPNGPVTAAEEHAPEVAAVIAPASSDSETPTPEPALPAAAVSEAAPSATPVPAKSEVSASDRGDAAPLGAVPEMATPQVEPSAAEAAESDPEIFRVPEVGTSAIANSAAAREEFGDKPVPVRAAISMARRLQDPLGELVRVDPKLLAGSHHGQDVAKGRLERTLQEELEISVHEVPVDLNLAPAPLLALVGGMGRKAAKAIVEWRRANGRFPSRVALALVGLDEQVYRRAVAFLRVPGSAEPLDETGVHPDHAPVVAKLVAAAGAASLNDVSRDALESLDLAPLSDDAAPLATLRAVRDLLLDRGVDPRGRVLPTPINTGVRNLGDLAAGQELDGVVRGVAAFGAFVDIGLAQEGLIHISELADHFVEDAGSIVQVGERVRVRVIEVDPAKKKIALTLRSEESRKQAEEERAARREARTAARERAKERRRREKETAERRAAEAAGTVVPSEPGSDGGRGRGRGAGDRRAPSTVQRAATSRRDGGGGRSRGGFGGGDRRGRRDGRSRDDFGEGSGDAPIPVEPRKDTPPPPNPFKKFFQSKGLIDG